MNPLFTLVWFCDKLEVKKTQLRDSGMLQTATNATPKVLSCD